MRGANIIGKLVSGQSLKSSFKKETNQNPFGGFGQFKGQQKQSNTETEYNKKSSVNVDNDGFTEYEDVTDR